MAKAKKAAKVDDAARGNGSGGEEVALPAGVGTQQDEPAFGPAPVPRDQGNDRDDTDGEGEDVKRLRSDKARWDDNVEGATLNELLRDGMQNDADTAAAAE